MTTSTRRWLAALAVAATAMTVASCDGGEDPTRPPETTATGPSTEPSEDVTSEEPTATPPEVEAPDAPPEMEVDDATGAAAATWYFLQLYDYLRATGETQLWDAMVTDDCGWCATVREQATAVHAEGGWFEAPGLTYEISNAQVTLPDDDDDFYTVRLDVVEEPFTIVSGDGTREERDGQSLEPLAVAVQYRDGRFHVVGVNFELG